MLYLCLPHIWFGNMMNDLIVCWFKSHTHKTHERPLYCCFLLIMSRQMSFSFWFECYFQHDAVSMNKVQKMRSSMYLKSLYSGIIQKRCWRKFAAKKMHRPCVGACSRWMNRSTVAGNVAWIQPVYFVWIASNNRHIVITSTKWARQLVADAVTVAIMKLGNKTTTVMNTK